MNTQSDSMREAWLETDEEQDEPRVQRCAGCGDDFTPVSDDSCQYCSESCWHLNSLGEVRRQILQWIAQGFDEKKILRMMKIYWFYWMTNATENRWKMAIHKLLER